MGGKSESGGLLVSPMLVPAGAGLSVFSCRRQAFLPFIPLVGAVPGQGAATRRVRRGYPGLAARSPALWGGQEAGWMFAIITQLQLPQSCRHSNGAGRPSRAAKWQEGVWALWAGREGGWHEPQAQSHWLSLSAPSPTLPSPEARGGGLSRHREVGMAQRRLQGRL